MTAERLTRIIYSLLIENLNSVCDGSLFSHRNFKHVDVSVRKMDVRYHGSLIRRHLNLRFSKVWIYVDGDRVEIFLWFYNARVKIGRGNFG